MKKILIIITVFIMVLSATPVYTTENTSIEHSEQCCYDEADSPIELRLSFDSCPVPGCGGLIALTCSNNMESDDTLASFDCTFSAHNHVEKCVIYDVIYYTDGQCNRCFAPIAYLTRMYGYSNTTHTHIHVNMCFYQEMTDT